MEKFVYDNDKTRMENYRIWKELNDIERELFNDKILSPMKAQESLVNYTQKKRKLYRMMSGEKELSGREDDKVY